MAKGKIEVEKNVPIPQGAGAPQRYPWKTMDVGDSFLVTHIPRNSALRISSVASRLYQPLKFTARTVNGGVRIWRIA